MSNYLNIPFLNPFKFVPSVPTAGIHFDDDWACKQIKNFERRAYYKQKWIRSETTPLQVESTIPPEPVKVYNVNRQIVKSFDWTVAFADINYSVYETMFDVHDLPSGTYFLYIKAELLAFSQAALSEPIAIADSWPNTMGYIYKHRFNDYGVAFSTGISFRFRCESAIMEFQPEVERTSLVNQTQNIATLSATPWRSFKLWVGEAPGVAPYIADMLNRIFSCSYINIEGKLYQRTTGAKVEMTRIKGYPLIGCVLEIQPQYNEASLSLVTLDASGNPSGDVPPGIVTAYNIETAFFGPGNIIPVLDVEQNY